MKLVKFGIIAFGGVRDIYLCVVKMYIMRYTGLNMVTMMCFGELRIGKEI